MKFTTRAALLAATLSMGLGANAENWYMKNSCTSNNQYPFSTHLSTYWTNSVGGEASATVITADDEFFIHNSLTYKRYIANSFPGAKLHLGAADGSSIGYLTFRQHTFKVRLHWHSGEISTNYSKCSIGFPDDSEIYLDNAKGTHELECGCSLCNFVVPTLHCSESDLAIKFSSLSKENFVFLLNGDNKDYKGSFSHAIGKASVQVGIVAGHANALGDPETERVDALSIDAADCLFSVVDGVTLNSARGIKINKSGFQLFAGNVVGYTTHDCASFALNMPITGTYGFTKTGSGTVTLGGAYTAGAITVEAGTLSIASTATFPAGQEIVVKSGATLEFRQLPDGFSIDAENGANVRQAFDVAYDSENQTVTPVTLSQLPTDSGVRLAVKLSSVIPVPSHTNLEWEVLTIESGLADVTADIFDDISDKTYGLPRTSFRVEKTSDGIQHVYMSARPVVSSVKNIGSGDNGGINGLATTWSDGMKPHEGADYLLTNSVGSVKRYDFGGDNLTIANKIRLTFRYENSSGCGMFKTRSGNPVVIYPGVYTYQMYSRNDLYASGAIELPGSYSDADNFDVYEKYIIDDYDWGTFDLAATLSGAGTLRISGCKNGAPVNGISGNNTNYFGRIIMIGNDSKHETSSERGNTTKEARGVQVRVSKQESLGGRLDTFHYDALTLSTYAMLRATDTFTLFNDVNRGIYIENQGGFNCDSGKVFTCHWPIRMGGTMYKFGQGTLRLGGELSRTSSIYTNMIVRAGTVEPLSDAAVSGLMLTATNDFTVALSTPLSTGFVWFNLKGNASPKVHVLFDRLAAGKPSLFESAICTVNGDGSAVEANIVVDRVPGYVCQLVKTAISSKKTRISLKCERRGLAFLVE